MKSIHKTTFFLIAITFLAFILRWADVNSAALWIDELYCFDIASKTSILEILKTVFLTDLHAPLFFVILHFWMKLVGTSDKALILLPVLFSTLSVPVGYFLSKKLFNEKTAVIFSIFNTISALEIYYAQELKFYSLLPILGLISVYCFLKIVQEFDIKNAIYLFLANTIIVYTFNAGVFFVAAEFIVGLAYLLIKKDKKFKNYLYSFVATTIFYLPYCYFQIKTMLSVNNGLCSLFDIFHFDMGFVFSLIQNFLTPALVNISNNSINYNQLVFIKENGIAPFIFYVLIFLILSLYAIYLSLKEKSEKSILIISLSVLFITILVTLANLHVIPLVTRYTVLVHLNILLVIAFGLSKMTKQKLLQASIFSVVAISLFSFLFYKDSAIKRQSSFHYYSAQALMKAKADKNDLVIMPYFGRFLYKYFDKSQLIDYRAEELLMNSDAFLMKETFNYTDKQYSQKDKSGMLMQPYVEQTKAPKDLEKYFTENYISKLNNGQRIFLIENYNMYIIPENLYQPMVSNLNIDKKNLNELEKNAKYAILYTKILRNLEEILSQHLTLKGVYQSELQDVKIFEFVFKK